jgi:uncharacterized damage-inducible protein DinB
VPDRSLTIEQILTMLAATPLRIVALTAGLAPAQLHTPPAHGQWSANDVLAHLRACADMWGGCEVCMQKSELLKGLQEEYQQWEALLDQIRPARMDQAGVTGHWSIKDIVAHLTGYQRQTVARLQAAQRSEPDPPPPWPAQPQTDDEVNAWIYESTHGRSVREVLDESQHVATWRRSV